MTTFLIDVWQDLQEKRLWPVALGLVAAIVAVPFVLFKPTSPAPAPATTPPAPTGPRLPVVSVDNGPSEGSKLTTLMHRNPFKPLSDISSTSGATSAGSTSSAPASAQGSSQPSGGGLASSSHALVTPAALKTASSSSSTSPASGGTPTSPPSGTPAPSAPASTPVRYFRFTVDVRFGAPGKVKSFNGLETLSMLPEAKQPVLVYMGIASSSQKAVFFIADPAFDASGPGQCNAKGAACRFVSLSTGDRAETFSTADGKLKYQLRLLAVHRVQISSPAAKVQGASAGDTASPADQRRAMARELVTLSQLVLGG